MTYFTALDVSLRFVSICIVDDAGQVRYEAKVPAEVHRIVGWKKATGRCATSGTSATSIVVSRSRWSWMSRRARPHTTMASSSSGWLEKRWRRGRGWLSGNQRTEGQCGSTHIAY